MNDKKRGGADVWSARHNVIVETLQTRSPRFVMNLQMKLLRCAPTGCVAIQLADRVND